MWSEVQIDVNSLEGLQFSEGLIQGVLLTSEHGGIGRRVQGHKNVPSGRDCPKLFRALDGEFVRHDVHYYGGHCGVSCSE